MSDSGRFSGDFFGDVEGDVEVSLGARFAKGRGRNDPAIRTRMQERSRDLVLLMGLNNLVEDLAKRFVGTHTRGV